MFLISSRPDVNTAATLLLATAVLALGACTPLPPAATGTTAPAPAAPASAAPAAAPAPAPAADVLQIDSTASLIAITVRRGGVLARLGHDHVVAARAITGTVSPRDNRAAFQFRLDQMTVDEPELRQVAGLTTQPSPDAIAGTRTNMLTKVLDADRYPLVTVRAERDGQAAAGRPLRVDITLHGITRAYAIPVTITEQEGSLTATGTVDLKQTDFGITPFSVMGGAMAVQDQMELRFTLVAR
jgi:polyisoprenoid-binding protein YceI